MARHASNTPPATIISNNTRAGRLCASAVDASLSKYTSYFFVVSKNCFNAKHCNQLPLICDASSTSSRAHTRSSEYGNHVFPGHSGPYTPCPPGYNLLERQDSMEATDLANKPSRGRSELGICLVKLLL